MRTSPPVTIRPLRRDESDLLDAIHDGLSPHSRHLRYHVPTPRLTGPMRTAMLDLDARRCIAVVAEVDDGTPVGLAQLFRTIADPTTAELAVAVVDAWQARGIGRRLVDDLVDRATLWDVQRIVARVLPHNDAARRLFASVFPLHLARRDAEALVLTGHLAGSCVVTWDDVLADLVG